MSTRVIGFATRDVRDNMEAALAAFREGKHDVLTDFVAKYEGKELSFFFKDLRDSGASAVAKGLEENKECKLEKLDISSNSIGAEGARHIAKALEVNKNLQTLWIASNNIGDKAAAAFADALKVNTTLTSLRLSTNGISDAGAQAMGEALRINPILKQLAYLMGLATTRGLLNTCASSTKSRSLAVSAQKAEEKQKAAAEAAAKKAEEEAKKKVDEKKKAAAAAEAAAKKKAEEEAKKDAYEALRRELEALKLNLAEQKRLQLDSVVSAYRHVRAERNQGSSGLVLTAQWRKWLFVLQRFKDSPPRDPWQQANCDGLLQLEANLEPRWRPSHSSAVRQEGQPVPPIGCRGGGAAAVATGC
eukprot:g43990.t1